MMAMKVPYGIWRSVVFKVLKPKPLMTRVPTDVWSVYATAPAQSHSQFDVPPLGTLAKKPRKKYK